MTIIRRHDTVTIECDSCGAEFTLGKGVQFQETWEAAKREGWRVRKIADEWLHGCPKPACKPE